MRADGVAGPQLEDPLVARLASGKETSWLRPQLDPAEQSLGACSLTGGLVEDAHRRFRRFAPWFADRFPQTRATDGIIESEQLGAAGSDGRRSEGVAGVTALRDAASF